MRLASFNVDNLFLRAIALNLETWDDGKEILNQYARLNEILQKQVYSETDKAKILDALKQLNILKKDESEYVILRQNHGRLLKRPKSGPTEVIANGRNDWMGWLELKVEAVDEIATKMTAKVIKDVNADILAVIEAEDRITLKNFDKQLLKPLNANYSNFMLIDGNDDRGIDVGLLTKPGFTIESIVSHVDEMYNDNPIFSRDCPEYSVRINDNTNILVMINHLKSKGYGSKAKSDTKRKLQANKVKEIYELRKSQGIDLIAIVGDFNDTPDSDALTPLLANNSELKDIFMHPKFDNGGRPGTFGNCTASQKFDYILLSPKLFDRVKAGGILRKGVWGGKNGTFFPHYDEILESIHAASDHGAVWADIDL